MAKPALPTDFLPLKTLQTLQLQADFASAAYRTGDVPTGYRDVDLASIGVDTSNIDGNFFENNGAAARVMTDGSNWALAFRGTNSTNDLLDYLDDGDNYIDNFDNLLDALATVNMRGTFSVTGHSLGGAAVHQLRGEIADYGGEFLTAKYYSFASPIFDTPNRVAAYGHANDAIYGYDTDNAPPYVDNVFWWREGKEIDQVDLTDSDNESVHSIDNHVDGLGRIIRSDVFDSRAGLVDESGLDLSVTTILSGTHAVVDLNDIPDGTMVFLGVDARLAGETKAEADLSDVILGRAIKSEVDWIDGMRGDDLLAGRAGDDRLFGGLGHDTLEGGKGRDIVYGGTNTDTLEGGLGADRFVFTERQSNPDLILDFTAVGDASNARERDTLLIDTDAFGGQRRADLDFVNARNDPDAQTDGPTILYGRRSGSVFFDADGTGDKNAVLIATLEDGPTLLQDGDVRLI